MTRNAHISLLGDNEIAREGLKRLLVEGGFETRCMALGDVPARLDEMADEPSHLVLIDTYARGSAMETCERVRERLKQAKIVLLDASCDFATVREALAHGADCCFARQTSFVPLLLMLELAALGEAVLPRQILHDVASHSEAPLMRHWDHVEGKHGLSDRELSILRCLVDGDPNKIIARKLGITEATVKIHVKGILRKLQVINRTQAAIWVVNQRLFEHAGAA